MTSLLDVFGIYNFAVRDAAVLCLVAFAVYVLLDAGIFAIPQVGLMAIGAYTSAILTKDHALAFAVALPVSAGAGAAVGVLLGLLLGRLNGIYLAIASLAFSEVVRVAILNLPVTGEAQGLYNLPRAANDLYITGALVLAVALLAAVKRSRFGLSIVAMREDQLMARHQGIDVFAFRIALFGLAGLVSGLAGSLHVHQTGFVEPNYFNFGLIVQMLAIVVIGGMTFVSGPLIGTAIILGLPQVLTGLADYQNLVNGAVIVAVVAFAPGGVAGSVLRLSSRLRRSPPLIAEPAPIPPSLEGRNATPAAAPETVVRVQGVRLAFGGVRALDGVTIEARASELLGIIGPNGSGKTTLLNVLSGVYAPAAGEGSLLGIPMQRLWGRPHRLARRGVARTFQTIRLIDTHSVHDNVLLGMRAGGDGRADVDTVLREHGLAAIAAVPAGDLPYGLRRRVEIARAAAGRPRLLLLDEPTAGMTPAERAEVFETIATMQRLGIAVVIVEHDVEMMNRHCDRIAVLDFGKVIADGRPAEVLKAEEVVNAYIGTSAKH